MIDQPLINRIAAKTDRGIRSATGARKIITARNIRATVIPAAADRPPLNTLTKDPEYAALVRPPTNPAAMLPAP